MDLGRGLAHKVLRKLKLSNVIKCALVMKINFEFFFLTPIYLLFYNNIAIDRVY